MGQETSMALGSLLDDNTFHEVAISREKRELVLSVDRVRIREKISGDFLKMNLDRVFFIGGVPRIEQGLVTMS
jgi:contactin associated protein-like 2